MVWLKGQVFWISSFRMKVKGLPGSRTKQDLLGSELEFERSGLQGFGVVRVGVWYADRCGSRL